MIQSKGMITSDCNVTNIRSKASITNFASSLREDDLMISSSMIGDPLESKAGGPRNPSKLSATGGSKGKGNNAYQEHLAI